ncbi:MAG: ABC transporter ATP-binding protein [Lautropia sp.]
MSGVSLERVSCRFGAVVAVDDVSLEVAAGEFVTLLGPSGCGKTTILRMVAGLENGSGGKITIGGTVVSDADRGYFLQPDRRRIGMVFQSYAIWPHMTVFDNVAYPLRVRRRSADEITRRVTDALRLVEMSHFADRPAPALSGGQQQRVAIARALVFEPELLLLDEPLSNLDAKLRLQMGDEFRALQKRLGITSLYVTHDQEEAMALSDRIVVMQGGRMLQTAAPETVYRRPETRTVAGFFGMPNLLEGQVAGSADDAGGHRVEVRGSGWAGRIPAGRRHAPGDEVVVVVRPESLRFVGSSEAREPGLLSWPGRVTASVFRGPRRSVVVQTAAHAFHLETSSATPVAVGDEVTIAVRDEQAWVVPA